MPYIPVKMSLLIRDVPMENFSSNSAINERAAATSSSLNNDDFQKKMMCEGLRRW